MIEALVGVFDAPQGRRELRRQRGVAVAAQVGDAARGGWQTGWRLCRLPPPPRSSSSRWTSSLDWSLPSRRRELICCGFMVCSRHTQSCARWWCQRHPITATAAPAAPSSSLAAAPRAGLTTHCTLPRPRLRSRQQTQAPRARFARVPVTGHIDRFTANRRLQTQIPRCLRVADLTRPTPPPPSLDLRPRGSEIAGARKGVGT